MRTEQEAVKAFRKIRQDYEYDPDIMCPEDERVHLIKEIVNTKLSLADRTIILLYADCASYRKLGARLGVSHTTIRKDVRRIRKIIMREYEASINL